MRFLAALAALIGLIIREGGDDPAYICGKAWTIGKEMRRLKP
jgi:hypothetical protein